MRLLRLKANRVSGVGIIEYLVVQRKDISDDSHTSAPDWLRVSLSHSFLVLLLVSAQIQPGNMPNLHKSWRAYIRASNRIFQVFTKREDVSSAWLPRLRQRLHHLLLLPHFTGASSCLQRPLPPCFDPIIGLGHPSRWQFFASGPNIRSVHRIPPPRLCA